MRAHVDAARGQKADARLEQIERGRERDLGVACELAQLRERVVRIAGDARGNSRSGARVAFGNAAEAPSADCSRKRSAISPTERPPTVVMPAIESRSVTSACAAFGSEPASAASTP